MSINLEDPDGGLRAQVAAGIVDVFVYVVVLNLFIEYFPQVLSESFTLSLLAAVLLKGILELVLLAEKLLKARFGQSSSRVGKVVGVLLFWAVLVSSKFVVLESVAVIFGGRVRLGGFFHVVVLILALLLARAGVRRLLQTSKPPQRKAHEGS